MPHILEVSEQKGKQPPPERMGRRVAAPGQGKQHASFLLWKNRDPQRYEQVKKARRDWRIKTIAERPWWKHYASVTRRCRYDHWYARKGIQCLITIEEVRILWVRHNAQEMKEPNLDRIDSSKGYFFDNCRFCEREENQQKMLRERREKRANASSRQQHQVIQRAEGQRIHHIVAPASFQHL